jgi:ribosomal protein S28E/S33
METETATLAQVTEILGKTGNNIKVGTRLNL